MSVVKSGGGLPFQTALFSVVLAVVIHAPTMFIWFVSRIFMIFGCLGIVRAQEIEPLGRRVKRFDEKK